MDGLNLGGVYYPLGVDDSDFVKKLDEAPAKAEKSSSGILSALKKVAEAAFYFNQVRDASATLFDTAKSWATYAADTISANKRLQGTLGATQAEIVGLQRAFLSAGLNADGISEKLGQLTSKTMLELQKAAQDAASEVAHVPGELERVGISAQGAGGKMKTPVELLRQTAQAVAGISDPTQRARIAIAAFGESGMAMLPVLAKVAKGFSPISTELDALNMKFTAADVEGASKLKESFGRLSLVTQAFALAVGKPFLLPVANMMNALSNAGSRILELVRKTGILGSTMEVLAKPIEMRAATITKLADSLSFVKDMREVDAPIKAIATSSENAVAGLKLITNQAGKLSSIKGEPLSALKSIHGELKPIAVVSEQVATHTEKATGLWAWIAAKGAVVAGAFMAVKGGVDALVASITPAAMDLWYSLRDLWRQFTMEGGLLERTIAQIRAGLATLKELLLPVYKLIEPYLPMLGKIAIALATAAFTAPALSILGSILSAVVGAVASLLGGIIALGGPWALLIGGVVFLALNLGKLHEWWLKLKKAVADYAAESPLGIKAMEIMTYLGEKASETWAKFRQAIASIPERLRGLGADISTWWKGVEIDILKGLGDLWDVLKLIWNNIKDGIMVVYDAVKATMTLEGFLTGVTAAIVILSYAFKAVGNVIALVIKAVAGFSMILGEAASALIDNWDSTLAWLTDSNDEWASNALDYLTRPFRAMGRAALTAVEWVLDKVGSLGTWLGEMFSWIGNGFLSMLSTATGYLKTWISGLYTMIANAVSYVGSKLASIPGLSSVFGKIVSMATPAVEVTNSAAKTAGGTVVYSYDQSGGSAGLGGGGTSGSGWGGNYAPKFGDTINVGGNVYGETRLLRTMARAISSGKRRGAVT